MPGSTRRSDRALHHIFSQQPNRVARMVDVTAVRLSRHSCLPNRRLTTMGFPGTTVGALNVRGCPQYNLPLQRRLPVIGRLITLPTQ